MGTAASATVVDQFDGEGGLVGRVMMAEAAAQGEIPKDRGAFAGNAAWPGLIEAAEGGDAKVTLLATGSEVGIAVSAREALQAEGIPTKIVSVPCFELFDEQPESYRKELLGEGTHRRGVGGLFQPRPDSDNVQPSHSPEQGEKPPVRNRESTSADQFINQEQCRQDHHRGFAE